MPKYAIVNKLTGEIDNNCSDCLLLSVSTENDADFHFNNAIKDKANHMAVKIESDEDWDRLKDMDVTEEEFDIPEKQEVTTEDVEEQEIDSNGNIVPNKPVIRKRLIRKRIIPARKGKMEVYNRKFKIDLDSLKVVGKT